MVLSALDHVFQLFSVFSQHWLATLTLKNDPTTILLLEFWVSIMLPTVLNSFSMVYFYVFFPLQLQVGFHWSVPGCILTERVGSIVVEEDLLTSWINSGIHYQNVSQFKSRASSWTQYRCRNTSKMIKRNERPWEQIYKNHSNESGFVSMQY